MNFSLPTLEASLSVLTAMVTPALMILALRSLILTTTNRLVRVVDRVREMLPEFEQLVRSEQADGRKRDMLFEDLGRATTRARIGQQALAQLYLGLGAFLATSIALGVVTFTGLNAGWLPLLFGAVGVVLLFSASILLIFESRSRWPRRTRRWTTSATSAGTWRHPSYGNGGAGACSASSRPRRHDPEIDLAGARGRRGHRVPGRCGAIARRDRRAPSWPMPGAADCGCSGRR